MTVSELIAKLQKLPGDSRVEIAVRTFTQRSAVAYVTPLSDIDRFYDTARITISLPEGYVVSKRKGS